MERQHRLLMASFSEQLLGSLVSGPVFLQLDLGRLHVTAQVADGLDLLGLDSFDELWRLGPGLG